MENMKTTSSMLPTTGWELCASKAHARQVVRRTDTIAQADSDLRYMWLARLIKEVHFKARHLQSESQDVELSSSTDLASQLKEGREPRHSLTMKLKQVRNECLGSTPPSEGI